MTQLLAKVREMFHKWSGPDDATNVNPALTNNERGRFAVALDSHTQNPSVLQPASFEAVAGRFWRRVNQRGPNDCWLWGGSINHNGYGILTMNVGGKKRNIRATHVSLALHGKPRVDGLHALHSCDTPSCCNPAHLRWGTNVENVQDRISRGRPGSPGAKPGEAHGNAKLTEEAVRVIRGCDQNPRMLAHIYGVSIPTIYNVKSGHTWGHVL